MSKYYHLNFAAVFLLALMSAFAFNSHVQAQFAFDPCAPTGEASCASTCDDTIGCSNPFSGKSPGIYGQADAVFWTLGGSKRALIQRFDFGTGDISTAFTANDLRTTRGTPRVLLGLNLNSKFAIEGQYNGFSSWNSMRILAGDGDLLLPGALGTVANDYFLADRMIVRSETAFHSAEINLVRKVKQTNLSTLAGFRYINFEEKFGLNSTPYLSQAPDWSSDYLVHAKNDLYGGQLGLKWNPEINNRFGLNIVGKAGIFGNNAGQTTWLGDDNNAYVHRDNISVKKNCTAFVGELNLGGYFKVTENLSFIGGYNLMWVGDTARAANQLDFTYLANSSQFVATDTLFMHGANVGLNWNF